MGYRWRGSDHVMYESESIKMRFDVVNQVSSLL